ncbi:hypothetical protein VSDG_00786 [Cytospora chrysosperma]|uniref:Uncharacterized protein n=1 Tax=Cytospora chrysosperma TaxID=252740 RepID=A0A423WLB5_CYTCH|nr:hypothetical protein VSDG_00786 [Valsa sordida]
MAGRDMSRPELIIRLDGRLNPLTGQPAKWDLTGVPPPAPPVGSSSSTFRKVNVDMTLLQTVLMTVLENNFSLSFGKDLEGGSPRPGSPRPSASRASRSAPTLGPGLGPATRRSRLGDRVLVFRQDLLGPVADAVDALAPNSSTSAQSSRHALDITRSWHESIRRAVLETGSAEEPDDPGRLLDLQGGRLCRQIWERGGGGAAVDRRSPVTLIGDKIRAPRASLSPPRAFTSRVPGRRRSYTAPWLLGCLGVPARAAGWEPSGAYAACPWWSLLQNEAHRTTHARLSVGGVNMSVVELALWARTYKRIAG